MNFKKEFSFKMFSIFITSAILLCSYYYFQPTIKKFYEKGKLITKIGTDQLIYNVAMKKGFISGEKLPSSQNSIASISYRGIDGEKKFIYIPFEKSQVKSRKGISVFLTKETSKGMEILDVTHEPGIPYFLSPFDMGGKFFELKKDDKVILTVKGKEKIPEDWSSFLRTQTVKDEEIFS